MVSMSAFSSHPTAEASTGHRRGAGRYAPSPSGDLHLGNLRTAVLAWLMARTTGRRFLLRIEDLDRVQEGAASRQLADLEALGLDWDGEVLLQSTRREAYEDAVARLRSEGRVYECFCTRREIREAASAPHGAPGAYPGTCRKLSEQDRAQRRRERPAALRLAAQVREWTVTDRWAGQHTGTVDDLILLRNDGLPAYNLAVVVDDAFQGVDQVVRGDDLLSSAPRQAHLAHLLGLPEPKYAHVPLAVNPDGRRLAKRDGAVTLRELAAHGVGVPEVLRMIAVSLPLPSRSTSGGLRLPETPQQMLEVFSPEHLQHAPWTIDDPVEEARHLNQHSAAGPSVTDPPHS